MTDTKILELRKMLKNAPSLTNEEFRKKMSFQNDEENIDDLKFDKKTYDILNHITIN
jgi:hypothetical protein